MMNTVVLYDKLECPFCWKVRMALAIRGITFERHPIDTHDKSPEFLLLSPKGTVPVLVVGGAILDESSSIISWADAQHPEQPSLRDAASNELEQFSDKIIGARIRDHIFMRRDKPRAAWDAAITARCQAAWDQILTTLNSACHPGGPWFLGSKASVADCALGARIALANHYGLTGIAHQPALHTWYKRLQQTAEWQLAAAPIGLP